MIAIGRKPSICGRSSKNKRRARRLSLMGEEDKLPPPTIMVEPGAMQLDEIQHPDGRIEHPRVRMEGTDVSFRAIIAAAIAIAAALASVMGTIRLFIHEETASDSAQGGR